MYPNNKILSEKAFISGVGQLCLLFIAICLLNDKDLEVMDLSMISIIILTNVGRIWLGSVQSQNKLSDKIWYRGFATVTLVSSVAWSLLCSIFLKRHSLHDETPVSFLIINAGISAAATAGLSPDKKLARAFTAVAVIPISTTLLFLMPKSHIEIAGILIVYMGFLFAQIKIQTDTILSLRDTQEHVKAMSAASMESIIVHRDGYIVEVNSAFERLMGYTQDEVLGKNLLTYTPREDQAANIKLLGIHDTENRLRAVHKDGTVIHVAAIGRWFEYKGERTRVTCVRDISFQMKAEKALRDNAAEIERLAVEREKALVESIKVKTDFLANMSHEIRTPLNAIIGIADLLDETTDQAVRRRYTETLKNSSESLLSLVNDILDFSKIDVDKMEIENVSFKLSALIEGQCELVAKKAQEKRISLSSFLDPNLPSLVESDFSRLGQIVLNLLSNAIKFTDKGSVAVNCLCLNTVPGTATIRVEVLDTGMGITPEAASKLFKPFSQADSSMSRKHGGTGLGLSICKKIIETMKGTISYENRPTGGTCFYFEIPVKVLDPRKVAESFKSRIDLGVKVQIIGDDLENTTVLENYVKSWGFKHTTITLESLNLPASLEVETPEIVITSCKAMLSDKISEFRPYQKSGAIKFIAVKSADFATWEQEEAEHVTISCDKLLAQPLRQSDLFNAITELTTSKKAAATQIKKDSSDKKVKELFEPSRVLVVEDNSTNQMIILSTLRNLGLSGQAVANGIEAINALEQDGKYDLVLMDCQMPEMDGYEATRKIRQREVLTGGHIPIVALTANIFDSDRDKCFQSGMDGFVAKPVRRDKLIDTLKIYLKTKNQMAA